MAENWCKEHQQAWFKKGKMKGYAHPILDSDGEPTGEWCNKPKDEDEKPSSTREGSTATSIEAQVAFKGLIELCVADRLKVNNPVIQTAIAWALTRLGGKVETKTSTETESSKEIPVDEAGQAPGEVVVTNAPQLMKWAISHGKEYHNSWVRKQASLGDAVITDEIAVRAHLELKALMNW